MKKALFAMALVVLVSGCSTMTPARYSMSVDNNQVLKKFEGRKVYVETLTPPKNFDANCRMMGPIEASDNMTVSQFVQKAFNDEFKFAGLYSASGVALSGALDKVEFSSMTGLTNGYWDLGLKLTSSNGKSLAVENRYELKSGFDAITACNQTAQALDPAVQDLIKKAVTDPQFAQLIQ